METLNYSTAHTQVDVCEQNLRVQIESIQFTDLTKAGLDAHNGRPHFSLIFNCSIMNHGSGS